MGDDGILSRMQAQPEVETVIAAIADLNGALRGKRMPVAALPKLLESGMRMPLSAAGVDIWGEDIEGSELVFETGDADGICHPTGRGLLPMGWTSRPTALLPMWLACDDGTPFPGDPRRALDAVLARYRALGLRPVVAAELEFYLVDPAGPVPQPPRSPVTGQRLDADDVYSVDELQHFDAVLNGIYDAARAQGIGVDSAISENGAGQFEINMAHVDDPLRAADDALLFKRVVRGVARTHGLAGSFMAKPYGQRAGNGFHLHVSLLDEAGRNLFDDSSDTGSVMLRHAVAGMLATMAENTLIFAPHANSYRRLTPGTHAPAAIGWGYENRTTALRIPGGDPKARRIEHRVAGADANPYLVLAAILGGALLGIEGQWRPPAPVSGDAYAQDLPQLPPDWASAIAAFGSGPHVETLFSPRLRDMFTGCKRQELAVFRSRVSAFEYRSYLETV